METEGGAVSSQLTRNTGGGGVQQLRELPEFAEKATEN